MNEKKLFESLHSEFDLSEDIFSDHYLNRDTQLAWVGWERGRNSLKRENEKLQESLNKLNDGFVVLSRKHAEKERELRARIARLEGGLKYCLGYIEDNEPMEFMSEPEHVAGCRILSESPQQSASEIELDRDMGDN